MRIQQPSILGELIICIAALGGSTTLRAEVLTLSEAIKMAEANNRSILVAAIERTKARDEVDVARTYRWPVFSVTALGSQSLSRLGLTFDQGALGVYPGVGPIPGETTTLESPLQPAANCLCEHRPTFDATTQDRIGDPTGARRRSSC
jgi:hypothetical protein